MSVQKINFILSMIIIIFYFYSTDFDSIFSRIIFEYNIYALCIKRYIYAAASFNKSFLWYAMINY